MKSSNYYIMNGNVFLTQQTFKVTCAYVCERQSMATVLDAEGVRAHDPTLMAADFEWQHQLMPDKEKPVFHAVLTFPPGEQVSDEKLVEIGRKFMQQIEVVNTQYAFVKHLDKPHLHLHIVANRVDYDGKPTAKGLVIERAIKASAELTREYGLRPNRGKRLSETRLEALHEPDAKRYQIYQAIQESLPRCQGMDDLEKELLRKSITMRYRRDKETGERQGISFRLENRSFKGSRVDKAYSLKGLEKTLVLQQTMLLREKEQKDMLLRLKQSMKKEQNVNQQGGPGESKPGSQKEELRSRVEEELSLKQQEEKLSLSKEEGKNLRKEEESDLEQAHVMRRGLRHHF